MTLQRDYPACPLCGGQGAFLRAADCTVHPLWSPALPPRIEWHECAACGHVYTRAFWTAAGHEELFRRAARLANVELRRPERAVARTTAENLRVGVLWGYAGLVDALVRRMRSELGGRPKVVATGGLARMVAPECETVDLVDDGLTLKGLQLLWEASR